MNKLQDLLDEACCFDCDRNKCGHHISQLRQIIAVAVEALKEFKEEFHDSDGYDSDEHGIESCGIACKALKQIENIAGEK